MRNNQPITQRERSFPAQQRLISTTNAKGQITYCNETFIEISGFSRDELMGAPHNLVRHPDVPPAVFEHMWQTLKQGKPWMGIVKNRCKNGDHYWVNAYVTPVSEKGQLVGYESVRIKPTAEQVRRAEKLYQRINSGKSAIPSRDRWLPVLQDWLPFILVSQIGFLIGAWLDSSWGFLLAALLSIPLGLAGLNWQQRGIKRLLQLAEQTTSDPLIAQMYTDSRGAQGRLELSMLSQDARMRTCLTRLQDSAENLAQQAQRADTLAQNSSAGLERQRQETEQVATAVNEMAATTLEVASNVARTAIATQEANRLTSEGRNIAAETREAIQRLSLSVGETETTFERLYIDVGIATLQKRDTRLYIRADKSVPYGEFIRVMNILRADGFLKIGLVGLDESAVGPDQPVKSSPLKTGVNCSSPRSASQEFASVASISRTKTLRQATSPPWVWSWIGPVRGTGRLRSK